MADVDDVQAYGQKFQNQLEKVRDADIPNDDRDAILELVRHLDAQTSVNQGTIVSIMNRARLSSERANMPLVEMAKDDVDQLLFDLNHEHGLSEGTLRNYRKALRKLFAHRGEEWAEDIKIGASPERKVDPNDLLTGEEIDDLLDAANVRDTAAIALLADTGLRIGAVCSLRVRDVNLSGRSATLTINDNANVKGASGTVPVTWSEGHLTNWLDAHPRRDQPDVALIHKRSHFDGEEDGALTYQYLSRRIRTIAEDAGVKASKVNTHNFRKTAITRWIREGMSDQAIKHRATWDVDTDMFSVYSGVRDEELNDEILDHYDIGESEGGSRPPISECYRCDTTLRGEAAFCPSCGAPQTQQAADRIDEAEDESLAFGLNSTEADDRSLSQAISRALKRDSAAREAVARELEEDHS